jgi:hypothetical protein
VRFGWTDGTRTQGLTFDAAAAFPPLCRYDIVKALVTDLTPDGGVKASMNEINAQRRLKDAATAKADGEKILLVKMAEADKESKYLSGLGVAQQRSAIVNGLKGSIVNFSDGVDGTTPADVMDLLLVTQYFDTLKVTGKKRESARTPGVL